MTAVPGRSRVRRRLSAVVAAVVATAASACSGDRPTLAEDPAPTSTERDAASSVTTEAPEAVVEIATARSDEIAIYADADDTGPQRTLTAAEAVSAPGQTPIVFLVRTRAAERVSVFLPVGPSGSTGWVDEGDVDISSTAFSLVVTLSTRRLRVLDDQTVVLDEPVGLGVERPPPGRYFLKELLQPADPDGPYGRYAYGLSGHVTVLATIDDGSGLVGLHGTDEPDPLSEDVTTGSIRLENDVVERLVDDIGLPLGTPVQVDP